MPLLSIIGWFGEKYDELLRKNANIRGRMCKKEEKRKSLLYLGENMIFEKEGGGGKNINYLGIIHP